MAVSKTGPRIVTVVREVGVKTFPCGRKTKTWLCRCECGKEFVADACYRKLVRSCGCQRYSGIKHGNAWQEPRMTSWKGLVNRYRQTARLKSREWSLTDDQAIALFSGNCHYCGRPPRSRYNRYKARKSGKQATQNHTWIEQGWVVYNGIDRKDNDVGYIPENCVTCCTICNFAKRTQTVQEFEEWLNDIVRYRSRSLESSRN